MKSQYAFVTGHFAMYTLSILLRGGYVIRPCDEHQNIGTSQCCALQCNAKKIDLNKELSGVYFYDNGPALSTNISKYVSLDGAVAEY